jgi:hypothetical protein
MGEITDLFKFVHRPCKLIHITKISSSLPDHDEWQ